MTSKTLTWVLGAAAVSLAVVLVVVLLQRPQSRPETADHPVSTAPTLPSTQEPSTLPAQVGEGDPGQLPSSEVDAHDASPGATPQSQTEESRRQWERVASGFGRAFTTTKGRTAGQWRVGLAPYVTGKVREQLATVDLRNVPDGTFSSIEPAEYGEDKVAVFVHYDTGLTLVTYLVLDGAGWRVYAYDRWED